MLKINTHAVKSYLFGGCFTEIHTYINTAGIDGETQNRPTVRHRIGPLSRDFCRYYPHYVHSKIDTLLQCTFSQKR